MTSSPLKPNRHARHKRRMSVRHRAGKQNAFLPLSSSVHDVSTAPAGQRNASPHGHAQMRVASAAPVGKQPSITQACAHGASDVAPCGGPLVNSCQRLHVSSVSPLCAPVEPGPARKNPTQIIAAACGRFHAVVLQEAHVSRTKSSRTPTAMTSPSCSSRTLSNLMLRCLPFPRLPQAKTHGEWLPLLSVHCCDALPFQAPPRSRSAQSMSTKKLPRNAMLPLLSCSAAHR